MKEIWNSKAKHFINKSMCKELDMIIHILKNNEFYKWQIPIRHVIDTDYDTTVLGDIYLIGRDTFLDEIGV